jgi:hypothetical protein
MLYLPFTVREGSFGFLAALVGRARRPGDSVHPLFDVLASLPIGATFFYLQRTQLFFRVSR